MDSVSALGLVCCLQSNPDFHSSKFVVLSSKEFFQSACFKASNKPKITESRNCKNACKVQRVEEEPEG